MSTYLKSTQLTIKDLVVTGIFSAIILVFTMIGGGIFAINPILTFYMPLGSGLLCGPIYLLMVAKVGKRWSISILGVVIGGVWFITGMHWSMTIGYIVMAVLADLVAGYGSYKKMSLNILSYMIFSLGGTYTYLIFFIDPIGWTGTMLQSGTDASYIETMKGAAPIWVPYVIIFGTLVVSFGSGWLGSRMLKKQFEKSGIV